VLRSLPLRTRVFLALAFVALVPVTLFGAIAVAQVGGGVRTEQEASVLAIARLGAQQIGSGGGFDSSTAQRLALATSKTVTILTNGGVLLGASDPAHAAALPAGFDPTAPPPVVQANGAITAYAPILGPAGQPVAVLAVSQPTAAGPEIAPLLATALVLTILLAVALSFVLARSLVRPLTEIADTLERLQAGDLTARLPVEGDDELAHLAASHNRLAAALAARNRSLQLVLEAIARLSPKDGVESTVSTAESAATDAFGFLGTRVTLGAAAADEPLEERVPGEAYAVSVPLQIGDDRVGRLTAMLTPTRDWGPADTDLLAIFGSQLAVAIRNAELYADVQSLSELKSDFLRGVSHNLQTPLTSIRAFAERLNAEENDPHLAIIVEQSQRLSRLVDQLLTVSKLEAGTLRPNVDVLALGPLVGRVWQSLGREGQPFDLRDEAPGWLVAADRDWVEQVLWALLDNAVKYGGGGAVEVGIGLGMAEDPHVVSGPCIVTTVRDHGQGVPAEDRERVFERFTRLERGNGDGHASGSGTGLGLSVARGLVRGMGGDLWLADVDPGATFAFSLPAERIEEA